MKEKIKIAAIAGSLRRDSYNNALIRAAIELKPENMEIEILDISGIPVYNDDERIKDIPESVKIISGKVSSADGLLIATPEYNYSIPGILKNAIDWVSKMPDAPFNEKATAIMGASPGMLGTVRAQMHLRQISIALNLNLLNKPEVYVTFANEKFDTNGKLIHEPTKDIIKKLLIALGDKINK
ncbi:MAG: NADPH-dependent FMN reductase [Ignavibacteria bacterium]|jgi:chromate reductase